jgi:DNA-binding transcriptional LysR family regulator
MAQPPLSQQIRQMEAELGFSLFHRTKRTVQLTEAGQAFLEESRRILRQLEQAIQAGRQINRGEMGQLVIGFVSSAAYNVLPEILRTFRTSIPGVTLQLHELTTDQQFQWLREGQIDVGFVRPPVEEDKFSSEIVFEEALMVALPEAHPLALQANVQLHELAGEPFILFPRSQAPGLYDQIISLCQQADFSPTVAQEAIQMQTIVSLVAAEMGVAIVPASLQNLQRTGVVYKPVEESTSSVAIAIIWRSHETSPTVQRFLKIVKQVAKA